MPASVQSPADVLNVGLARIGYKLSVGSLLEGSTAAKKALDIYAQTRDELLQQNDWPFAERNITMTLLKQAPATGYIPPNNWSTAFPPLPWIYEYAWPSDCLKVRAVKPSPLFLPNFDPQPNIFATPNDNSLTPAARVICCNVQNAQLVYTGQVTNPASWNPDFVEVVASALGRRLGPVLMSLDVAKLEAGDEQASMQTAERQEG